MLPIGSDMRRRSPSRQMGCPCRPKPSVDKSKFAHLSPSIQANLALSSFKGKEIELKELSHLTTTGLLKEIHKANPHLDLKNSSPTTQRAFWHIALWLYASDELVLGDGPHASKIPVTKESEAATPWQWLKAALPQAEKYEEQVPKDAPREAERTLHKFVQSGNPEYLEVQPGKGDGGFWHECFKVYPLQLWQMNFDLVKAETARDAVRLAYRYRGSVGGDLRTVAVGRDDLAHCMQEHLSDLVNNRHSGGTTLTHGVAAHMFWMVLHGQDTHTADAARYFFSHLVDDQFNSGLTLPERATYAINWRHLCDILCEMQKQMTRWDSPYSPEDIAHTMWRTFCFFFIEFSSGASEAVRANWRLCVKEDLVAYLPEFERGTMVRDYRETNVGLSGLISKGSSLTGPTIRWSKTNEFLNMLLTGYPGLNAFDQARILIGTSRYKKKADRRPSPSLRKEMELRNGIYWTASPSLCEPRFRVGINCRCADLNDIEKLRNAPERLQAERMVNVKKPELLDVLTRGFLCPNGFRCGSKTEADTEEEAAAKRPSIVKDKGIEVFSKTAAPLVERGATRTKIHEPSFAMLHEERNRSSTELKQFVTHLPKIFCEQLEVMEARWLGLLKSGTYKSHGAGCLDSAVNASDFIQITKGVPSFTKVPLAMKVPALDPKCDQLTPSQWELMAVRQYLPPIQLLPLEEDPGCVCGKDTTLADSRTLFSPGVSSPASSVNELRAYRHIRMTRPDVLTTSWVDLLPANLPVGVAGAVVNSPNPADFASSPDPGDDDDDILAPLPQHITISLP